jgi:ATP-binding cassette subfamily F protein 1
MGKKNKRKNNSNKRNAKNLSDEPPIEKKEVTKEPQFLNGFALTLQNNKHSGDHRNISVNEFSINTPKKQLFNNANLVISYGKRYGLIGPNGKGKTTILNHIAKRLFPMSPDLDILLVEQEVQPTEKSVLDVVLDANEKKRKLEAERDSLQNIMETQDDFDDSLLDELQDIEEELLSIGSEKDESDVRRILNGLGFLGGDHERPTKDFSGGWRMRVAIAKALYMKPTLLLLDEPTNHLDLNAVIWLTNYLSTWKKSLLIVSHNQHFLNDVCTDILHISEMKLDHYRGNYYKFTRALKQKNREREKEWNKIEKRIKEMQKKGTPKKDVQTFKDTCGVLKPEKDYIVNINFGKPNALSIPVLTINDISFSYDGKKDILKNVDFGMDLDSRITIVGPNGAGKSTFINLLVGNLNPTNGSVFRNNNLKIAYYNQHFIDVLPMDKTPIEYLQTIDNLPEQEIRKLLGTIGLEGSAHLKKINTLSGGQKARVVLVSCQMLKPHVLVMDEPTNHLDIESINGLVEGINNFEGGVLIVSHDMNLITETECVLWVCENNTIKKFDGEYDDYVDKVLENI